jgi:hypothetical protein
VNPKMPWLTQSKTTKPYNKPTKKYQTLHNPRIQNQTTSQSKNSKASTIKYFQTLKQANPKMANFA